MRSFRPTRKHQSEAGIALLIAIFVLLLISVVAIAVVVSSGTESALTGNYRSSTGVYYAALAGVEEARARLRPNDLNSFQNTWPALFPSSGANLPMATVCYVLNPSPADNAGAMFAAYPDTEYDNEFGLGTLAGANVQTTQSVWNKGPLNGLPVAGPLYKWVRINAVSEKSLNLDVDADGQADSTNPLYYDGANHVFSNNPAVGSQALELTALAVLPNGSQKLVQYLSASAIIAPPGMQTIGPLFLAGLTISGSKDSSPIFQPPTNNSVYAIQGVNRDCSGNPAAGPVAAIGLFGDYSGGSYNADLTNMINNIPSNLGSPPTNPQQNYTGNTPPHALPDVEYLSTFPANLQSPAQIDAFAQNIIQNAVASFVPAGSASTQQAYLSSLNMSPTNPVTVIVNGDLDLTDWTQAGYGLLLVTGTLTYDPATTWNGAVLVIGQGQINNTAHGLFAQINGAVFVAKTRDAAGNLLTGRIGGGVVSFDPPMQGNGIRYSSCWIQRAQPIGGYKILSFHEISQ
jgi:hypothetical protein